MEVQLSETVYGRFPFLTVLKELYAPILLLKRILLPSSKMR